MERNEEFAFRVDGVDVLLLEDHGNAETSQLTGIADGVQRISGEAGDRLGEDHIDLALPALTNHAKELLAPTGGGSCDALIRENVHHRPIRILHDLLGVERFLVLIAGQLLFITGGYAAVSGDAQISFLCLFLRGFLFSWNDNDFSFRTRLCHELSRSFRQSRGWPMLPGIDHFSDERAHRRPDIRRSELPAAAVLRPVRPSLTAARECCGGGGLRILPSGRL